jgi:DUF2971 family protein
MSKQPDDYLYHYTTPEGLMGIVKNQELWATSVFFLNDIAEFKHGIELGRDHLEALFNNTEKTKEHDTHSLQSAIEGIKVFQHSKDTTIYVCSFSEEPDDLSQWRAYCPMGGFAIGFPKERLWKLAGHRGYSFGGCIYSAKDKTQVITLAVKVAADGEIDSTKGAPQFLRPPLACNPGN